MKNWKEELAAVLESGKQPTYEQLEAALNGAMTERNAMESTVCDMAAWLGKMVAAYLHDSGGGLHQVMNDFIAARVRMQVVQPAAGTVH